MNQSVVKQMLFAVVAWALAQTTSLGEIDGAAAHARLDAGDKIDKAACVPLTGPARDVCTSRTEAKRGTNAAR
jgi:hypothetical protein